MTGLSPEREYDLMAFAQKTVVAGLELFGPRISPGVLAGAIEDAGGLDGYATPHDYELALGDFICMRRRHATYPHGPFFDA